MLTNKTLLVLPGDGIGPEVMAEVRRAADWLGRKRAVRVDRRATDQILGQFKGVLEALLDGAQHLDRLRHHLRPDAVAGEKKEFVGRHCALPRLSASPRGLLKACARLGKLELAISGVVLLVAG